MCLDAICYDPSIYSRYYGASLRLIKVMAVGNLLPHPLAHSDELFQYAAPFER